MKKYFLLLLTLTSCGIGPYITKDQQSLKNEELKNKKIIVGNFLRSDRQLSITNSLQIREILESASVRDISFQVSNILIQNNIESEARKDFKNIKLNANEILLNGAIMPGEENMSGKYIFNMLYFCFVIGMILPSPISADAQCNLKYFYELSDSSGKIIYNSDVKEITGYYKNYYFLGSINKKRKAKLDKMLTEEIYTEISNLFK